MALMGAQTFQDATDTCPDRTQQASGQPSKPATSKPEPGPSTADLVISQRIWGASDPF